MSSPLRQIKPASFADVVAFAKNRGMVGEEKNFLTMLLAVLGSVNVLVEAPSGSGKTTIVEPLLQLLPDGYCYKMRTGSSKAAIYDAEMRNADMLYVTELQKAAMSGDYTVEMLKDFGDGKPYRYAVTMRNADGFEAEYITVPTKKFITTFAITNKSDVLDAEMSRRVLKLTTDVSRAQTRRVILNKAEQEIASDVGVQDGNGEERVTSAVGRAILSCDTGKIINPCAPFLAQYVRDNFVVGRTLVSQFFSLVHGVTYFNAAHRLRNDKKIFATPADNWQAFIIAWEEIQKQAMQVSTLGRRILKSFEAVSKDEAEQLLRKERRFSASGDYEMNVVVSLNVATVQGKLRQDGYSLDSKVVAMELERLCDAGYVSYDEAYRGKGKKYSLAGKGIVADSGINWHGAFIAAKSVVKEKFPYLSDRYDATCESAVLHPITGEPCSPFEYSVATDSEVIKTGAEWKETFSTKQSEKSRYVHPQKCGCIDCMTKKVDGSAMKND